MHVSLLLGITKIMLLSCFHAIQNGCKVRLLCFSLGIRPNILLQHDRWHWGNEIISLNVQIISVHRVFVQSRMCTYVFLFSTHPTLPLSLLCTSECVQCMDCSIDYFVSLTAYANSGFQQQHWGEKQTDDKIRPFSISGDLGKAVGELVTVMTEDTSKTNGQRAPPPAFK